MQRLDAIGEMLIHAIGQQKPSALDSTGSWPSKTYGTTNHGQAEEFLDRVVRTCLLGGYASQLEIYRIEVPTYYYSYSVGTPSFTFAQELTDSGGAVTRFNYVDTTAKRIYVSIKSGTPAPAATSLGGFTVTASTAITSSRIAGSSTWLHAEALEGYETKQLEFRRETSGGTPFFFDRYPTWGADADQNPLGTTFTQGITVQVIPDLDFDVIAYPLQDYIVKMATLELAQAKKGSNSDLSILQSRLMHAKTRMMQTEADKMRANWHGTHDAATLGFRPDLARGHTHWRGWGP